MSNHGGVRWVKYRGLRFALPPADTTFGPHISRYFEEVSATYDRLEVPAGLVFVDVGACTGISTVAAAAGGHFRFVLAFEPDPANYAMAVRTVLANGLGDMVRVVQAAVSDRSGVGRRGFVPPAYNPGGGTVDHTAAGDVRLVRLDDAVADAGLTAADVGFVWCDAQGSEPHVLKGAPLLLAERVPLLLEVSPTLIEHHGLGVADLVDRLTGYDRVAEMRGRPFVPTSPAALPAVYARCRKVRRPGGTWGEKSAHTDVLVWSEARTPARRTPSATNRETPP